MIPEAVVNILCIEIQALIVGQSLIQPIKHIQVVLYCCSVNPFANYHILGSIHIHISISSHNYLTNLRTFSCSPDNLQRLESRQLHAALKGGASYDEVIAN